MTRREENTNGVVVTALNGLGSALVRRHDTDTCPCGHRNLCSASRVVSNALAFNTVTRIWC